MSIKAVIEGVCRAESQAADVMGNMEDAVHLIDQGRTRLADVIVRLEWAKQNVAMLPYYINEALAAAQKLQAEGGES